MSYCYTLIACEDFVTYSPDHVSDDGRHLATLIATLRDDLAELDQMVRAVEDAMHVPGATPGSTTDGPRQATHGPARPTERLALDESREALRAQLHAGSHHLPYAIAYVRGITASLDRALSQWEGAEYTPGVQNDLDYGSAEDA